MSDTLFEETVAANGKGKKPSLQERTGLMYPHNGYKARLRDPRLREYLVRLEEAKGGAEPEVLLWVLCAGVWWLEQPQAERVADALRRVLTEGDPCG